MNCVSVEFHQKHNSRENNSITKKYLQATGYMVSLAMCDLADAQIWDTPTRSWYTAIIRLGGKQNDF